MPWQVEYRKGVWLPQVGWWLDARTRAAHSFITHAHTDHIARHQETICTPATARFLHARLPGRRTVLELPFGRTHDLEFGVIATLHPAGHILGSCQVRLESAEQGSLLYTGDFKLRPGLAAEACAAPPADVLVMETTFGLPRYRFPPDSEVIAGIVAFCREALAAGSTPVLLCYSLGKSQEVLCGLAGSALPVMVHSEVRRFCRIYEELGVDFPPYREFNSRHLAGHVVICPPHASGLLGRMPAARTAAITGWALDAGAIYRLHCHAAFPLSDHADFDDLLRFVDRVRPRQVYTVHGFAREFAATLRARGIDALALGCANQLELAFSEGPGMGSS
jgi:Cft2 family RNA processing exonuclease